MAPIKKMQREKDAELVARILDCLPRPFKKIDPGRFENLDKYVAHSVRWHIGMLRRGFNPAAITLFDAIHTKSLPIPNADDVKLVKLLRERGYLKQADEIEADLIMLDIPRMPGRANELKFNCAFYAHRLMTKFTKAKLTKTKTGKFQEITALFYEAITGAGAGDEGASVERACTLVIKAVKGLNERAAAKEARKAAGKLRNAQPDYPPTIISDG